MVTLLFALCLPPGVRVAQSQTFNVNQTESLLAAGCGDGTIRIFHVSTGRLAYNLQSSSSQVTVPATMFFYLAHVGMPLAPNQPHSTESASAFAILSCEWLTRRIYGAAGGSWRGRIKTR